MTTKTEKSTTKTRGWWQPRAKYRLGKTTKQRRVQYQQQTSVLMMVVMATVVVAGLVVLFNWRNAGDTKAVDCAAYPQYCVPLAGGAPEQESLEAAGSRTLDEASHGAEGVVRYVAEDNVVTIGNPNAPIHFRVVSDYACSHCNTYHTGDLDRFVEDYVLTGQATLGLVLTTGTGGTYSEVASQAALCAGEQGAFWEMGDELYRLARSQGVQAGFNMSQIRQSADVMGLDVNKLVRCVSSGKYQLNLDTYRTIANDIGVTGTPTMLVSYGDQWSKLEQGYRSYENISQLTEQANAVQ